MMGVDEWRTEHIEKGADESSELKFREGIGKGRLLFNVSMC